MIIPYWLWVVLLVIFAGFFLYAGISHFRNPRFFYKITPPSIKKWEKEINIIVGLAEILGAIGLFIPFSRAYAAWGIIALLIAVFPANVYMLTSKGAGMKISMTFLWIRLPLQFVMLYWAWCYT